jgi:hypothetical protein
VSNLELRLPVLERVGVQGGYVKAPAKKVVPSGYELAKDFAALGSRNAKLGKGKLRIGRKGATVDSPDAWAFCHATVTVLPRGGAGKSAKKKKGKALARGKVTVKNGKKRKAKLKLTKAGRRALRGKRRVKVRVQLTTKEQKGTVKAKRVLLLRR